MLGSLFFFFLFWGWHVPNLISHPNTRAPFFPNLLSASLPDFSSLVRRGVNFWHDGGGGGNKCVHTAPTYRSCRAQTPYFIQSCTTFAITQGSALSIAKCCSSHVISRPCASLLACINRCCFSRGCSSPHSLIVSLRFLAVILVQLAVCRRRCLPCRRAPSVRMETKSRRVFTYPRSRQQPPLQNDPFGRRRSLSSRERPPFSSFSVIYPPSKVALRNTETCTCRLHYSARRGSPSLLVTHR